MSIVDLSKARAYAASIDSETSRDWITELVDEVESLENAVQTSRMLQTVAEAEAKRSLAERDAAVLGLQEIHRSIGAMLREARHVADNHPDPAAAGAALRILGAQG